MESRTNRHEITGPFEQVKIPGYCRASCKNPDRVVLVNQFLYTSAGDLSCAPVLVAIGSTREHDHTAAAFRIPPVITVY